MLNQHRQPMPSVAAESEPVADSLKRRFAEFVDARTAYGAAKYGQPLHTFDGRKTKLDMWEEGIDFVQYQEKDRMETEAKCRELEQENAQLRERIAELEFELGLGIVFGLEQGGGGGGV